jgi:Restriction endonuclease
MSTDTNRIEASDPRWRLAQAAALDWPANLLKDEMPIANLTGQLAMFAPVTDAQMNQFPKAFVFWRWPNAFEPIATFSVLWGQRESSVWRRVYLPLYDSRLELLLSQPCLFVRTGPYSKEILSILEFSPGKFDFPAEREKYLSHQMLSIGDVEAARHWVYWRLSKPDKSSAPAEQMQASFIEVRHGKVQEAIECIQKNRILETIPAEAQRMADAGFPELYGNFPYQREIYAYCREVWANHQGLVLKPFSKVFEAGDKADSGRLAYQLQELLTAALFSVERTRCGLILPSLDGNLELDLVDLEPETIGKERAASFWPNLYWAVNPLFRDAVGPGNVPVDSYELFTRCPRFEGDLAQAEEHISQFLSEAYALKEAVIPPGAYHPIDGGGILAAVRLQEFGPEVAATFVTHDGSFFVLTMLPSENVWRLHLQPPNKLKTELLRPFDKEGVISNLTPLELDERAEAELKKVTEPVKLGLALFVAALIRDFWVVERREVIFSERRTVRNVTKLHGQRLKPVTIYLPRIRYVQRTTTNSAAHLANSSRRPHEVSEHMRQCANADPKQIALAKAIGFHVPAGFTFVRRHRRGDNVLERHYRSVSALSLLAITPGNRAGGSFRDDWLDFERNTRNWLETEGWKIEQWSASRRGDHGIDIVISKEERLGIVQCKFWTPGRQVGPQVIRELIGTRASAGKIVEALLVTSSQLTEASKKLAQETGIRFVENVDFNVATSLPKYQ